MSQNFNWNLIIKRKTPYLVPDLLEPNLKLVFCGTAPSTASAQAKSYYAKPGNRFWPTLAKVGITPTRYSPHEYAQLLSLGVGLTDLCKAHSGTDAQLPDDAFNVDEFWMKMGEVTPKIIAFTSKTAAATALGCKTGTLTYGLADGGFGDVNSKIYVLCSPSGLATAYFDLAVWEGLAVLLAATSNP
jgi:double-stranded uracil-DNA glycosylase